MLLTREDQREMVRQIQSGAAVFVDRQSHRITRWIVSLRDARLPVVYDKDRHTIVTVLPPGSLDELLPRASEG